MLLAIGKHYLSILRPVSYIFIIIIMSNLLSLPFDVKLLIVRYLNLSDCLSFAQVSTVCHDIVYYVFSHRAELDFTSVIGDDSYLSLSNDLFL